MALSLPYQLEKSSFPLVAIKEVWSSVAKRYQKVVDWSDRATSVLFGDGAGGALLEVAEKQHFWAESQFTDGLRGQSLTCGGLGLSSPFRKSKLMTAI